MSVAATTAETKDTEFQRKNGQLTLDFVEAVIADPERFEDVPNGVMLVLLPDDDPEFVEACIERGIEDFKRGFNVYFRHFPNERTLPRDDLPAIDQE